MTRINGIVVHGDQYGRELGFPTANLGDHNWHALDPRPRLGIYAGWALRPKTAERFHAAIVLGPPEYMANRRQPDVEVVKIEAHLINFFGDLYGESLELHLVEHLRDFQQYDSESDLRAAIDGDIQRIQKLLSPDCVKP